MKKFRRKYFRGRCPECESQQKLKLVAKQDELGTIRMRCLTCSQIATYPVERVRKTGRVLTERQFKKFKAAMTKILNYSPQDTYFVGQKIRHPVFDEVGQVMKKKKSTGRHQIILVKFENVGEKELVEGYGPS